MVGVVSGPLAPGRFKESAPAAAWEPRACARAAVQPSQQGEVRRIGPRCLRARSPRRRQPSVSPSPRRLKFSRSQSRAWQGARVIRVDQMRMERHHDSQRRDRSAVMFGDLRVVDRLAASIASLPSTDR